MNYISINPYKFDENEGTFTLTSEQKVALNNSSMIRVGFKLLFKEYDYGDATITTPTTIINEKVEIDETTGEATITTTYKTVETYLGTWHFESDEYKLTFTSTSYTLAKK